MKNLLILCSATLFILFFTIGCGDGAPEAKSLKKGEKIELKDVNVSLQKLEKAKAIKSKDGKIVEAEDGKIIYIARM